VILACTVLIQLTSVTDRRTDGQTDRRPDDGKDARSILLSRVKKVTIPMLTSFRLIALWSLMQIFANLEFSYTKPLLLASQ